MKLASEKMQDKGQKAALHSEIADILKTTKPPPSFITKKEAKTIKALAKHKDITILPADKGRTTVIMDTDKYAKHIKKCWKTQAQLNYPSGIDKVFFISFHSFHIRGTEKRSNK